jgi:hypothetical protein
MVVKSNTSYYPWQLVAPAELLPTALRLAVALFLGSTIGFERQ